MHSKKFTVSGVAAVNTLKKYSISDREILDKRVKTNPRYADIRPRTNTGFNTHRRQELEHEIRKYYKVRNDEVFRRISLADLLQLMVAHAEDTEAAVSYQYETNPASDVNGSEIPIKYRDEVELVVHKMTQLEMETKVRSPDCPYVIIDVRPYNEYEKDHLATAVCHPFSRMSRAVGWECPAMLIYKNHPEFIIVIYDEGEDVGPEVVATLQHRGYENVFLLSGGLRLARDKFGPPLVTNEISTIVKQEVIEAITLQLSHIVLPPLSMAEASDWWEATTKLPNASDSANNELSNRTSMASTGRHTSRSQLKTKDGQSVPPWR
ncbi:centrosomal protein of 41 kDa-like [Macrobrachium rosenbergii]|uniref:centrosomal protein of 41 kDa-like n=1 Tax=Macrobrachium rosenbergii TaxID=79674 RepID=UPI0034D66705